MNDTATGPWREALGFIDGLLTEDPSRREGLLSELAATHPELHSRVRALLEADAEATRTGFMRVPMRDDAGARRGAALCAGSRVGPYRIERELGTGGMGEVWLARRDDGLYEGEVAIKTLHPFFAHGVLRERFLREAQLLGKLTHPNIARLLDAGVSESVVYLVLEYIRGESLDAYCDARALGLEPRLKLFGEVCAAVAHAHANLIIHRDIKPSNILVTGQGQVKLLDFGIGKIVENEGSDEGTELTRVTGRIFTPEFAAPEQVRGEAVTTATDVYSLGTLLYVLLAGVRPFGERTGSQVEHAVLHEEPPSLAASAREVSPEVAANRGLSPRRLARMLAGDLENIVHLALRKSPRDRYGSVLALADDLGRYSRHEPVLARAGSRAYRIDRFVRRHRVGVAASIGVLLAALVGVAGVLYQAREAREQARLARIEAAKATSVRDYLLDIFEANSARHPDGVEARKTTAEELMDIASEAIIQDETLDAEVRVELMATLENIHGHMEKYAMQEALARARIRIAEQKLGVADVRLADALNDYGEFLRSRGRMDEAVAAVNRALALRDAQGDVSSWTRGVSELELGKIYANDWGGEDNVPIEHFERAISILDKLPLSDELVRSYLGLARAYEFKDDYPASIAMNRKGIALAERVSGPRSNAVAGGSQQLARALAYSYRLDEAEQQVQKAVDIFTFLHGADGGFTTNARLDVARLKNRRGQNLEAVRLLEPLLARRLQLDDKNSSWLRNIRAIFATALIAIGDFGRAREMLDANREPLMKQNSVVIRASGDRWQARLANEERRHADALRHADAGLANLAKSKGASTDPGYYHLRLERAEALVGLRRIPEARATLLECQPLLDAIDTDPDKYDGLLLQIIEASADLSERKIDDARAKTAEVLARFRTSSRQADMWQLEATIHARIAEIEFAAKRPAAACPALDAVISLRSSKALPTDPRLLSAKRLRATCAG